MDPTFEEIDCPSWFGLKFPDLDCTHWLPYMDAEDDDTNEAEEVAA